MRPPNCQHLLVKVIRFFWGTRTAVKSYLKPQGLGKCVGMGFGYRVINGLRLNVLQIRAQPGYSVSTDWSKLSETGWPGNRSPAWVCCWLAQTRRIRQKYRGNLSVQKLWETGSHVTGVPAHRVSCPVQGTRYKVRLKLCKRYWLSFIQCIDLGLGKTDK